MTNADKIVAFVQGGKPEAFCDDCIGIGLNLPRRQQVAAVTLTLARCNGYRRALGSCASKDHSGRQEKLVIRAL